MSNDWCTPYHSKVFIELGNMLLVSMAQMLFSICFLLHPNRLNSGKIIIPQNMRDHTGADIRSIYQSGLCQIKDWCGFGCGCVGAKGCILMVYLGVCIPERHRRIATPAKYRHHAWTAVTHPHPHVTSATHLPNN